MQSRKRKSLLEDPHNKDSVIVDPHDEDSRTIGSAHCGSTQQGSLIVDPPDYMGLRMAQSIQNPHHNRMVLPTLSPGSLARLVLL